MPQQRSIGAKSKSTLIVGEPFIPFGLFNGIFIPEALLQAEEVSLGAKVTYGQHARYAGQDGNCYPSVPTLARKLVISVHRLKRY